MTHCNALQHTATQCNTMQNTATHQFEFACLLVKIQEQLLEDDIQYNFVEHLYSGPQVPLAPQVHCNALQHTATHCNIHCNTLRHTATYCNALQHTATPCNALQHTAPHCNTLKRTATPTHCNMLQRTPTLCTTLHHTATHLLTSASTYELSISHIVISNINESCSIYT